jgi:hypothetical protein
MNIKRRACGSLSLWIFSIAVATFPVILGIYAVLPYSTKDHYIFGWKIGIVYLTVSIISSVSLLITSIICSYWDRSVARRSVMIGSIAMLVIYALGVALYYFSPA